MIGNRKQLLINPGMQMKFTLLFVCISLAGCFLSIAVFNYMSLGKLESLMWSTHLSVNSTSEIVRPYFLSVSIIDFLFVAILLSFTGFWMLRKTAGPLLRISKDLREITEGNLSRKITLRQNDEFRDTAAELNAMAEATRDRFVSIKEQYMEIENQIQPLNDNPQIDARNDLLKNIGNLRQELQNLARQGHKP